ncbi:antibiotic biosynthesis monooxygenase [Salipaludibacillus agaradhaerens]|jgi:heme oxygenase (staphylobilin-producing)|uniref:Antibiotic biosynthesis monooxygenase n=1 Tax=Salipaludibacillus agaradhaerens TaxID=76935 RepID=A0A9Q4B3Y7_SALAG|nr:antibiotic biosynthesis monooxygenase [Salipaludibacillus agaradhaerens]MCR6097897.1 antibiotic biosynthesis monooxygenase [Salipaludibacillus agaradhaerens]MCR6116474.1 antibiotic biosynthesis monooxygenase [Salipaludibacillus agaradhaerens]
MFIEMKNIHVTHGSAQKVVDQFASPGVVEEAEGFVDLSVLVKETRKGPDEVVIMIRWESEEAWKQWEKSEPHLNMHRQSRGKAKPEHIISSSHQTYDVKAVKEKVSPAT